jgi:hypothetical protein
MRTTFPRGSRPNHSHETSSGSTSKSSTPGPLLAAPGSSFATGTSPASRVSSPAVPPASSQSLTSPFSGSPGSSSTFTFAPAFTRLAATRSACFLPGGSLSGRIATLPPASVLAYESLHLPAPIGQVVAAKPSLSRRCASLSPSTTKTGLPDPTARSTAGSR